MQLPLVESRPEMYANTVGPRATGCHSSDPYDGVGLHEPYTQRR